MGEIEQKSSSAHFSVQHSSMNQLSEAETLFINTLATYLSRFSLKGRSSTALKRTLAKRNLSMYPTAFNEREIVSSAAH